LVGKITTSERPTGGAAQPMLNVSLSAGLRDLRGEG